MPVFGSLARSKRNPAPTMALWRSTGWGRSNPGPNPQKFDEQLGAGPISGTSIARAERISAAAAIHRLLLG